MLSDLEPFSAYKLVPLYKGKFAKVTILLVICILAKSPFVESPIVNSFVKYEKELFMVVAGTVADMCSR